jgi:1-acyl-sn-glycerol-3-phosphate acyltransferase
MLSFKSNFAASFPELIKLTRYVNPPAPTGFSTTAAPPSTPKPPQPPVNRTQVQSVDSDVVPWLSSWMYPLSHQFFLPSYFRHITIAGQEHLAGDGSIILAPTHRSRWDGLLVPYAAGQHITGKHLRYMVTSDEMQGLQGWFIRRMGGFPIDTRTPGISSLRHGIELLHRHETLVIFPEGGELLKNRQRGLNRLHPGLARLALQAIATQENCTVRVIPMAINYSDPTIGRGDVAIQIGRPIVVNQYVNSPHINPPHINSPHGHSAKQIAKQLTQDLSTALTQLSHL